MSESKNNTGAIAGVALAIIGAGLGIWLGTSSTPEAKPGREPAVAPSAPGNRVSIEHFPDGGHRVVIPENARTAESMGMNKALVDKMDKLREPGAHLERDANGVVVLTPARPASGPGLDSKLAPEGAHTKPDDVKLAIEALKPAILDCYEQGLKQDPKLEGRLVLEFTLDTAPDGGAFPSEGQVSKSSTPSPVLDACILATIGKAHFQPLHGNGKVIVKYPIRLSPEAEAPEAGGSSGGQKP